MQRSDLHSIDDQFISNPFDLLSDEIVEKIFDHLKTSDAARLGRTCRRFRLFDYAAPKVMLHLLLEQIVKGRRSEAMSLITQDPGLLLEVGTVEDHANRTIEAVTPLQLAFGMEDADLFFMICNSVFKYMPNGYEIALMQIKSKFGIDPFLKQLSPFDFSRLVVAICNYNHQEQSSIDEINSAYQEFIQRLEPRRISSGFHFNFKTYLEALFLYKLFYINSDLLTHHNDTSVTYLGKKFKRWNDIQASFFWVKIIGGLQRQLTAPQIQDLCKIINNHGFRLWQSQSLSVNSQLQFFEDCLQPSELGVKYALGPRSYLNSEVSQNINGRDAEKFITAISGENFLRRMSLRDTIKLLKSGIREQYEQESCLVM